MGIAIILFFKQNLSSKWLKNIILNFELKLKTIIKLL